MAAAAAACFCRRRFFFQQETRKEGGGKKKKGNSISTYTFFDAVGCKGDVVFLWRLEKGGRKARKKISLTRAPAPLSPLLFFFLAPLFLKLPSLFFSVLWLAQIL